MKAFLFGWNPVKFKWGGIDDDIGTLEKEGKLEESWSVASHKSIAIGDRAYVVRVGAEPRGIFASGFVSSKPYQAMYKGRSYYRVAITLEVLLNPDREQILTLDILKTGNLAEQVWTPQASGISIKPHLAEELEGLWLSFLDKSNRYGDL